MADNSKSLDILGAKPVADSIKAVADAAVAGSSAFLSRICLPAAEAFGLLLRDRVEYWRALQVAAITKTAEKTLREQGVLEQVSAPPRLVSHIIEEGSWMDDPIVQDLWAGLLSSSCTESGDDDSNLVFVNLLSAMTKLQAAILKYSCENAPKYVGPNGLIDPGIGSMRLPLQKLVEITNESDIHRLDRELDHLRELGLISGGFSTGTSSTDADVSPTALGLSMYVRCQGSRLSPVEYFNVQPPAPQQTPPKESATTPPNTPS